MTKSEMIEKVTARLAASQSQLSSKDVELAVKTMIDHMSETLSAGSRIEIRGFGSFSLHYRAPRVGRNPKTGESVGLSGKYVPHFKPGKELRERVNIGPNDDPRGDRERVVDGAEPDGTSTSPEASGLRTTERGLTPRMSAGRVDERGDDDDRDRMASGGND